MRKLFYISGIISLLLLSGCASKVERADFDAEKASKANTELGVAYLAQGRYNISMEKLKKALKYNDDNADAHHYIAELYRRLKQNNLANEHFSTAMDLKDEDSAIKNNYGIFLCGTGSYNKGLELFKLVLTDPLYREKGRAYENMGFCAEKMGNIKTAERYFKKALKLNRRLPGALLGMAQISFDKRDVKAATDYLNRHNSVSQVSPQSLWLELILARKKGLKGKMGSLALKLKQYFPDSREVKLLEKLKLR